jgi:hypothetical protein
MSRERHVEFFLEPEGEVTATVTAGFPARYPEPAEPPEVEDLYVGVILFGTAIDVTHLLTPKQLARIREQCLEQAADDAEADASEIYDRMEERV